MTSVRDPRGAMESTLAAPGSATGPVTFSHVFGQQCQLMEAGRKRAARSPRGRGSRAPGRPAAPSPPRRDVAREVQLACDEVVTGVFTVKFLGHAASRVRGGPHLSLVTSSLCGYPEDDGRDVRRIW